MITEIEKAIDEFEEAARKMEICYSDKKNMGRFRYHALELRSKREHLLDLIRKAVKDE